MNEEMDHIPYDLTNNNEILIAKYLDNEITQEEGMLLWNWINESEENKIHFEQTAKAWEKSVIELQDHASAEMRFQTFLKQLKTKKQRILYRWFVGSAAAIIFLFIGLQLFQSDFLLGNKTLTVLAGDTKKEVVLPDGSIVWLNAKSTLKYSSKFTRSRNVFLTGEAYFNVKKDKKRMFSVRTNNVTIDVLGTKFLITNRSNANVTETTLESGKINLTVNASGKKLEMKPNQQVIYNNTDGSTKVQIVNAADYTSWHKARLAFENTRLKDVFIQLEKWYNINITCNKKTLQETPVSFTVDNESIEDILNILQQIASFRWERKNNSTISIE